MTGNDDDSKLKEKSSGRWGIARYWWVLIIVVAMGYLFGKDLALKHNEVDQGNTVSIYQKEAN